MNGSRAWTWRHAIIESDLPPTTRHVLLTISCHMNDRGEGCFPSMRELARETGRSLRAVCEHINVAIEAGWLVRFEHGYRGQRWKRSEYRPGWPPAAEGVDATSTPKLLTQDQHLGEGVDATSTEVCTSGQHEVLTQRTQDKTSQESSHSLSLGEGGRFADLIDELLEPVGGHRAVDMRAFLVRVSSALDVRHQNPRALFGEMIAILRPVPTEVLVRAADEIIASRAVLTAPKNVSDAIATARQLVREAEMRRSVDVVSISRAQNPQAWAAWLRAAAQEPRRYPGLARVMELSSSVHVPSLWPTADSSRKQTDS